MIELKDLMQPEIIWCFVGIILLIAEFMLPGFVIFFFGIGAFIVSILCLIFNIPLNSQLLIFIIASIISLFVLRRWFRSIFKGMTSNKPKMPKNIDSYIGETAVVTEKITPETTGKIEFHGTQWKAASAEYLEKDDIVVIIKQNNLTFEVTTIKK
ncbi:MAG: NfeD family protein [bacterium]|nr:NfeD family protein [bacterium]